MVLSVFVRYPYTIIKIFIKISRIKIKVVENQFVSNDFILHHSGLHRQHEMHWRK